MLRSLVILLLLVGCVNAEEYSAAAITAAERANDIEATVLTRGGCTLDLAAWGRMEDMRVRVGYFYACVPDAERWGVTLSTP